MNILSDAIYTVPFGIIYTVFFQKLGDILFANYKDISKLQKNVTLVFFAGIIGLILSQLYFNSKTYRNKIVKQGLVISGIICIFWSSVIHWDKLTDYTKLFLMGISLGGIIWYCSYNKNNSNSNTKMKKIGEDIIDKIKDKYINEDTKNIVDLMDDFVNV